MPSIEEHRKHFKTLESIRVPRVLSVVAWMLVIGTTAVVLFLAFAPWVQTTAGTGSVTALDPGDRLQEINALVDGRIEPLASVRTKRKALGRALEIIEADTTGKGALRAAVLHAAKPDEADQFYKEVQERLRPVELYQTELTPVIGTHTGPGLVGLAYYNEP